MTATPPSQARPRSPSDLGSPPGDTQALSQFVYPPRAFADDVEDEAAEGVWGYLIPLDDKVRDALVFRKRDGCDAKPTKERSSKERKSKESSAKQAANRRPGGYLIGRHPECGKQYLCNLPMVLLI